MECCRLLCVLSWLEIQGLKEVVGEIDRQLAGIGVIGLFLGADRDDIGIFFPEKSQGAGLKIVENFVNLC